MIAGWDFQVQDFKATMAEAIALGDAGFAFIDPPYEGSGAGDTPDVLYSTTFGKAAHDLLANKVTEATNAGVKTMITINYSTANLERYAAYKRIVRTQAYSTRKKGSNAKKVGTELVIQTYESPFFNAMIANTNWEVVKDGNAA
jgi:DNA adenine methylase